MPKRQAEHLSQAISVDFDAFYTRQQSEGGTGLLVMSVDGKGVVMRKHSAVIPSMSEPGWYWSTARKPNLKM